MTEKRTTLAMVRLSEKEKRELEDAAREKNLPMTTWLRALGLRAARAAKGHSMKAILVAVVLGLAACGGTDELFKGDVVTAELSNGAPSCSQGVSGPTLHTRTATTTDDTGNPYESTIVRCEWTCGQVAQFNGTERAFMYVDFFTREDGTWGVDAMHADTIGAVGKIVCP